MAFYRLLSVSALFLAIFLPSLANCQTEIPSARFRPLPLEEAENTRPFAAPGIFDYDAQIFAPLEFYAGEQLGPKTGFFASFDRGAVSLSSESDTSSSNYGPTNRYNFGWMTTEEDGWEFLYEQTKANEFLGGGDILISTPLLLRTNFANVEANRVFRQVLRIGSWIEPYVGFRYINVSDETIEDSLGIVVGGVLGDNRFTQNFSNDAAGVHVGGRYVQRRGRWRLTSDLAISTLYNNQRFRAADIFTAAGAAGPAVAEVGNSEEGFLPAFDYRLELGYNLTRDFGLRGGVNLFYLWDGVARANPATTFNNPNSALGTALPGAPGGGLESTNLIAAGYSFGFEWRR